MSALPPEVERVLERGSFCHVGTATPVGPHVTPMVFVLSGGRLWVTTARTSVKAGAWRVDDRVAGLIRDGEESVAFTGRVRTFDAFDSGSWGRSVREGPALARATARFAAKNARFFAGYAVDARAVPLGWMPPGRVLVELTVERWARLGAGGLLGRSGRWPRSVSARERFRSVRTGIDPLGALPLEVAHAVGRAGPGALAVEGSRGVVVLPVERVLHGAGLYAALPERVFALAGVSSPRVRVALGMDRPTWWRARLMIGAMVRGEGQVYALDRLSSGRPSASAVLAEVDVEPAAAALVRVIPRRVVWWRGWSSGTVQVA